MEPPSLLDISVERYKSFSEFRREIFCEIADSYSYLAWVIGQVSLYLPEEVCDNKERIQEFLLPVLYEWLDRGLIRIGNRADDALVLNWSSDHQKLIDRLKQEWDQWDDYDALGDPTEFGFTIYIETTEKGNEYIFEQGWPIHELHYLYPRYLEWQKKKQEKQKPQSEPMARQVYFAMTKEQEKEFLDFVLSDPNVALIDWLSPKPEPYVIERDDLDKKNTKGDPRLKFGLWRKDIPNTFDFGRIEYGGWEGLYSYDIFSSPVIEFNRGIWKEGRCTIRGRIYAEMSDWHKDKDGNYKWITKPAIFQKWYEKLDRWIREKGWDRPSTL